MGEKARRQHGTGSVMRRRDGKWVGRIEAGYTGTGGRRRIAVLADTEAECKRKLREKQRRIATEGIPEAGLGRVTVKAWADVWLERHAREVRPKTYATDASAVRKWIIPTIGRRRLDELTPGDVNAVRAAIVRAGRTTTTARHHVVILESMLRDARQEGHQVPVRVTEVKPPKKAVNDRDAVPVDGLLRMLKVVHGRPDELRWITQWLYGMRQAETLGLTWECVDLDRGVIDISWQLQALPYIDRREKALGFRVPDGFEHRQLVGAWHLTRPKTAKGQRVVPLVAHLAPLYEARSRLVPANPWDLVWSRTGKDGAPLPIDPDADRAEWRAIQAAAGVAHPAGRPFVGHETRHAAATVLHRLGVDPATIEAIMGHSSFLTSRLYIHIDDTQTRNALEGYAKALGMGAG